MLKEKKLFIIRIWLKDCSQKLNGSRKYIMEFIISNFTTYGSYVTAIISAASIIAAVTPTPKDDEAVSKAKAYVAKAYKLIDFLALNILKAKDK